jgi:hypothetical protein
MLQEGATKLVSEPIPTPFYFQALAAATSPNELALTIFTLQTQPRIKFLVPTFISSDAFCL